MKRTVYKPIRRQPKRIYAHSTRNPKKRKRLFFFLLILIILILIYVPGHNGLIKITGKKLRISKLHNEIENLKVRIELVRTKTERADDPEYIKRYAYDRYGMIPKSESDTIKKP
jgi:cell division protein FtsB